MKRDLLVYFSVVGRLEETHANGDRSRLHIVGDKWTLAFTPYFLVISGGGDSLCWRLLTQKTFERRRSALPGVEPLQSVVDQHSGECVLL